jgi:hypothetical protein
VSIRRRSGIKELKTVYASYGRDAIAGLFFLFFQNARLIDLPASDRAT